MMTLSQVVKVFGMAMLMGIAIPAFAESAPVYDVDSMQQQQFDNGLDQGQDLPAPPAPEQEGGFVPAQQVSNSSSSSTPSAPVSSGTVEQRLRRVEQQINNMQNSDSSARIDSLQGQIQALRGQVEQLTHQLQQAQSQLKSQYADLDKRLAGQPASSPVSAQAAPNKTSLDPNAGMSDDDTPMPAPMKSAKKASVKPVVVADNTATSKPKAAADQPNVAEEQQIYQTAYNLIKAKKYEEAVVALQKMLQKYPSGQFASNAHYWLGELYGLLGKNDQALTEFSTVVKMFPDSPRVSDAQLKVGLIYAAESNWSDAKSSFKKVINRYPGTASARLASEQLKQIKQAGH